jgi:hypothetical protein
VIVCCWIRLLRLVHHLFEVESRIHVEKKTPGRWLRITVFLVVTSPYTAVYDEIRHENGPYFAVILVTIKRYLIQHRILYRIRSYAYRILITNGRKPPTWIPVKIRCVNGPYMTVYGRICAVYVPYMCRIFRPGNQSNFFPCFTLFFSAFHDDVNTCMTGSLIEREISFQRNILGFQLKVKLFLSWCDKFNGVLLEDDIITLTTSIYSFHLCF